MEKTNKRLSPIGNHLKNISNYSIILNEVMEAAAYNHLVYEIELHSKSLL
jgi:hypothetical protein